MSVWVRDYATGAPPPIPPTDDEIWMRVAKEAKDCSEEGSEFPLESCERDASRLCEWHEGYGRGLLDMREEYALRLSEADKDRERDSEDCPDA